MSSLLIDKSLQVWYDLVTVYQSSQSSKEKNVSWGGIRHGAGSGGKRRGAGRPRTTAAAQKINTRKRVQRWRWRKKHDTLQDQLHQKVYHRSKNDTWGTPREIFNVLHAEFHFTLDAAASPSNALCPHYFTILDDALSQPWIGTVFLNPPYGREVGQWVRKAYESSLAGATVVCLVKATPDTKWWHQYTPYAEVRFISGRLRFVGADSPAPFPSCLVIFRPPTKAPL